MNKYEVHIYIIDKYLTKNRLSILEFGRIRNTSNDYFEGDGWSTLAYAKHPKVHHVASVDPDETTIKATEQVLSLQCCLLDQCKVVMYEYLSRPLDPYDLVFFDAENDAEQQWDLYLLCLEFGAIDRKTFLLIDDVLSELGRKGDIIIPALMSKYDIIEIEEYVLLKPKDV